MQFAYCLSGSKTRVQKFQIGATMANAGVGVMASTTLANAGIDLVTTALAADSYGITLDTATYATAQTATNTDPAAYVSVVVNPDAVLQCRLCGSATVAGTALVPYFNTALSTTGLDVTPSTTINGSATDTSAMDDCTVFGYSGANAGISRRITVGDATDTSVVVAFPFDIAVGDQFIYANFSAGSLHFVTFITNLTEADATVATGEDLNNLNYRPVELVMNDIGNNGLLNSYVNLIAYDHAYSGSALA